ncbi:hypothetical protein PoB_001742000 [Plakobranchus ocellatus]|uniref:Uncharacterized protein n=1 Tax=Plakobranchus ocellatus TaxID=259542 RepID=A0AAV3Z708_9GAST|nr:hypothetical protein PoB_001742000 [Plakobranchus ocellatus]
MVVEGQYREIKRAVYGMEELGLVNEYKKFGVPRDIWFTKDNRQRARHVGSVSSKKYVGAGHTACQRLRTASQQQQQLNYIDCTRGSHQTKGRNRE